MNQSKYDTPYSFRLRKGDRALLAELAKRWNTTKTGVVRKLIADAYEHLVGSEKREENDDKKQSE